MIDRRTWIRISLWVILTRIGDGVSTYLSTPTLYLEVNPLVTELGLGWTGLIVSGIVFVLLVLLGYYYSYRQQDRFDLRASSLCEYLKRFFFDFSQSSFAPFQNLLIYIGQIFPRVLIGYSLFLITNNLISAASHHYRVWPIFRTYLWNQSFTWDVVILGTLIVVVSGLLLWRNYRRYNRGA